MLLSSSVRLSRCTIIPSRNSPTPAPTALRQLARLPSIALHARASSTTSFAPRSLQGQFEVVDREREVASVLRTFLHWHNELGRTVQLGTKPPLPFSSQLFGAGKTTFGRNMLSLLRADLAKPLETRTIEPLAERSFGLPRNVLERYANAGPVELDLRRVSEGYSSFKSALWAALLEAVGATADNALLRRPVASAAGSVFATHTQFVNELVRLVSARDGTSRSHVFIFIDEIGHVDNAALKRAYPDLTEGSLKYGSYGLLLTALEPLLNDRRVLMFVAGKSQRLTEVMLRTETSPIRLQFLPMSPLNSDHIGELLQRSRAVDTNDDVSLSLERVLCDELGLCNVAVLAKRIHHYTAGVPRMIEVVLRTLLSFVGTNDGRAHSLLADEQSIDALLAGRVFDAVASDASLFIRPDLMKAEHLAAFNDIMLMALERRTFKSPETTLDRTLILDWANVLGFSVVPVRDDTRAPSELVLRVVLPRYTLMWLRSRGGLAQLSESGSSVLVLLALRAPLGALDQGRFFEMLVAQQLGLRLGACQHYASELLSGAPLALARTGLAHVPVPAIAAQQWLDVRFSGGSTAAARESTLKQALATELDAFLPLNVVVLGRCSTAAFADVVVRLHRMEGGFHFVGAAGKNYQSTNSKLTWAQVQQEVDKFSPVLAHGSATLLICATQLATDVQAQIDASNEGLLVLSTNVNKAVRVPAKMDVVVLGRARLAQLLGDERALTLLGRAFSPVASGASVFKRSGQ